MALGNPSNPFSLFTYPRIGVAIPVPVLPISDAVHCNRHRSALRPTPNILATAAADVCGKILCAQQIALLRGYHYFRTGFLQSFSCNCELGGSCRGSALHHYHQFAMEGFHGGLCEWFQ